MLKGKFKHYGVPTTNQQPNETHYGDMKLYGTNPEDHPFGIEFLRFMEGCEMPKEIQTMCHAAFEVDNLEEAIKGYKVILEPTAISDDLKIAFIMDDQALIELMQCS